MSQTPFVRSSRNVHNRLLVIIAQIRSSQLLKLVWDTLNKNFLLKSARSFNLLKNSSNWFIFIAALFVSLSFLSSDISISHIAAIKGVHLPIAVDRLWCLCLQGPRADEKFVWHRVEQIWQLLFLLAHDLHFLEEKCLRAQAAVGGTLHKNNKEEVESCENKCAQAKFAIVVFHHLQC